MSWNVMQKNWDSVFKVRITVWAYIIKILLFLIYLLLVLNQWVFCNCNQTQFDLVDHHKPAKKCPVKLLDCCVQGQCQLSQLRLNVSVNVSLDDIFWIDEPFVTKSGMVIQHYKPECPVQDMGLLSSRSKSQWNHDYFHYMFWTADLFMTSLVWQCMFRSWSVLWKGFFAVFKVKVIVKVLNFSECLPGQYLID